MFQGEAQLLRVEGDGTVDVARLIADAVNSK
jgi:hypothetical protein